MTAEEARELSKGTDNMIEIYRTIQQYARLGKREACVGNLTEKQKDMLLKNGYTFKLLPNDPRETKDYYLVEW